MQALAKWLKVDPSWLRFGGVVKCSFVDDYMSLCEAVRETIRAVMETMWRGFNVSTVCAK